MPQPAYGAPSPGPDPLAIVALVLGIIALPFFWLFLIGVAAIVFGAVALSRIRRTSRGGRGLAIAGIVLGAVSLALGVLIVVVLVLADPDDEVAITQARRGDCIDLAPLTGDNIETYTPRDCDVDHEFEIVGIVTAEGDDYPGAVALNDLAEERCRELFADYVGIGFDDSEFGLQPLMPTPEAWQRGDHEIACVALSGDGSPLTESVRGARR